VVSSDDLVNWTDQTASADLPSGHHGTVFAAAPATIGWPVDVQPGDFDKSGQIDVQDWILFLAHHRTDLSGLSPAESFARGDMDLDGDNDRRDFHLFRNAYHAAQGGGGVNDTVSSEIPEPADLGILVGGAVLATVRPKAGRSYNISSRSASPARRDIYSNSVFSNEQR
jgi:hypothetical protein